MKRFTSIKWGSESMGMPQLAVMGKIKIGGKGEERKSRGGGKYRLPEKFDHFVITSRARGKDDNYIPDKKLMKSLDPDSKPRKIPVILQYDDISLNFPNRLTAFEGKKLYCQGNGETARRREGEEWKTRECPCDLIKEADEHKRRCKPNGRLLVVLPSAPRVGAVYEFRTSAWETTRNIVSSMMHLQRLTGGMLAGIPLALEIYPATDSRETGEGVRANLNYKVALIFDGSYEELGKYVQDAAQKRMAARVDMAALESGIRQEIEAEESDKVHSDFSEEFHPEVGDEEETVVIEDESEDAKDVEDDKEEFGLKVRIRELAEALGRKNIEQLIEDQYENARIDEVSPVKYLKILVGSLESDYREKFGKQGELEV